ncbi:Sperm flagellar protein 2 [Mactra antiquata]
MAHRLELSLKDAAKSVKLYDKTVNVLAMGLYYFYHNSSLNRAMLNRSASALKTDGDKSLLLPTRVGGTRWIGHTALALEHLTVSYKYILGHLGQLTEPAERVSTASRAKAHAFMKLLQAECCNVHLLPH